MKIRRPREEWLMARKSSSRKKSVIAPVFRDLTKEESDSVLACNHVGRIAFSFKDIVDIRPIHYVFDDTWLFGRTSPGDKLVTLQHHQWVAFEVDEVSGPFDWKSVVAHGTFYQLESTGTEADLRLFDRALEAVKTLSPDIFTENDPVPFRTTLFGISLNTVTGRCCSTKSKA
jgi:nitroimidazol reductase NimA-like FMN-containing flavoprotein (pyridoxamine 5'-phosphate oxidase superfamily)